MIVSINLHSVKFLLNEHGMYGMEMFEDPDDCATCSGTRYVPGMGM